MGCVGPMHPCFLLFLYSVVAGQRAGTGTRPYTVILGWLIGRGVPMAQLVGVPRGQQEPSPYPSG